MKKISLQTMTNYIMRNIPTDLWTDIKVLKERRKFRSISAFILSVMSREVESAKKEGEI